MKTKFKQYTVRHPDNTQTRVRVLLEWDYEVDHWLVTPDGMNAIEKARHDWYERSGKLDECRCGVCRKGKSKWKQFR